MADTPIYNELVIKYWIAPLLEERESAVVPKTVYFNLG